MRVLENTVFLDHLRCEGNSHDGCQKACTLLWKESWLYSTKNNGIKYQKIISTKDKIAEDFLTLNNGRYFCQSTEMYSATFQANSLFKIKLLFSELLLHNQHLIEFLTNIMTFILWKMKFGSVFTRCKRLVGSSGKTPSSSLKLKPGDKVRVKNAQDIQKTLDINGCNRGLLFTPDMYVYCGKELIFKQNFEKMILEDTGQMKTFNNTILLETSTCDGRCKLGCARNMYHLWRTIWVERIIE